ncbi:MAG: hypothetical protein M3Z04_25315 [Chloroflexota bacterium]|nr:hypothetical protein [Chloroflexota bacterium]
MIQPTLSHLEAAGLIRAAADSAEPAYSFRHALGQDAAYASLLRADRRRLHRAVGETLETLYADTTAEWAAVLAHHFHAAADPRALAYFTQAADQALGLFANREAEGYYRTALTLDAPPTMQARLLTGLAAALAGQSRLEAAVASWRTAIAMYQTLGDGDMAAALYARAGRVTWESGDPPGDLALCQEGLAATAAVGDGRGRAALLHELARALHFNGRAAEALPLCRQALALAERLGDQEIAADIWITLGIMPSTTAAEQKAALAQAVALAAAAGTPFTLFRAHFNLGHMSQVWGDVRAGRDHYRLAYHAVRPTGMAARELFALTNMAEVSLLLGDFATVETLLPLMHTLSRTVGGMTTATLQLQCVEARLDRYRGVLRPALARLLVLLDQDRLRGDIQTAITQNQPVAEILLEQGDTAPAIVLLEEAVTVGEAALWDNVANRATLAGAYAQAGRIADAQACWAIAATQAGPSPNPLAAYYLAYSAARLACAAGDPAAALLHYAQAVARLAALGMPWYQARLLTEWAATLSALGGAAGWAQAAALLTEAAALFDALEVPYYATQARAQRAALPAGVPAGVGAS